MQTISYVEEQLILHRLRYPSGSAHNDYLANLPDYSSKSQWRCLRNLTIALLMIDAGLRVGEVVRLHYDDLYFQFTPVKVLYLPARIAKRQRPRELPLTGRVRQALKLYTALNLNGTPLVHEHCLFPAFPGGGILSTRQVERIITAASEATIGRSINPHQLRHTYATRLLKCTDIRTVQELLGHKNLSSTQIYTHVNSTDLQIAVDSLQRRFLDARRT